MFTIEEVWEEQERQYNQLMEEDDQYCHPESFRWGFEHGVEYALSKLGWHPASEAPPIKENGKSEWLVSYVECDNNRAAFLRDTVNVYYDSETKTWLDAWGDVQCVEWWSIPPKKEGEL